jgi:hypothetical protein
MGEEFQGRVLMKDFEIDLYLGVGYRVSFSRTMKRMKKL